MTNQYPAWHIFLLNSKLYRPGKKENLFPGKIIRWVF